MTDGDTALSEKRVYDEAGHAATLFLASELGLAEVAVSDDQIGRFGLVHRADVHDVAVDSDQVAVATGTDVLVGDGEEFESTDFGPAVAVGFADGLVAGDAEGRVARYDGEGWTTLVRLGSSVLAMDGELVATAIGVYRIANGDESGLALADVRDVAAAGPFAATGQGLYALADGVWSATADGEATAVAATEGRAVAVLDDALVERHGDGWHERDCPAPGIAALAVGQAVYVATADGQLFVDPPQAKDGAEGWASRSLGLTGVRAAAVRE